MRSRAAISTTVPVMIYQNTVQSYVVPVTVLMPVVFGTNNNSRTGGSGSKYGTALIEELSLNKSKFSVAWNRQLFGIHSMK